MEDPPRATKKPKRSHPPTAAARASARSQTPARAKGAATSREPDAVYIVNKLIGEIRACAADAEKVAALLECYRNVLCATGREAESGAGLLSAVRMADARIVRYMLAKGASRCYRDSAGDSPLAAACARGDMEIAMMLFDRGEDIHPGALHYPATVSPLCAAVSSGRLELVEWLVGIGMDANSRDGYGRTPLTAAASRGWTRVVRHLLALGADPNLCDYSGSNVKMVSAKNGQLGVLRYLVEHDIGRTNHSGELVNTLLAAVEGNQEHIVRYIIESKEFTHAHAISSLPVAIRAKNAGVAELLIRAQATFKVSSRAFDDKTALYQACKAKMVGTVRLLLSCGVGTERSLFRDGSKVMHALAEVGDVEMLALARSYFGGDVDINALASAEGYLHSYMCTCTPLAIACANGHVGAVRFLLTEFSETIDVNVSESARYLPLFLAAGKGYLEIVELLVSNGANVNGGEFFAAPLYNAASAGHGDVVRFLFKSGAVVNPPRGDDSALHAAARNRRLDVIACLVEECGADMFHRGSNGSAAFDIAVEHTESLRLMLSFGCEPDFRTLCHAVVCGNIACAKELLAHGVDVDANCTTQTDQWDLALTPLMVAVLANQLEMVRYLCDCGADVEIASNQGETALHLAVMHNAIEIVEYLVRDKQANTDATTALGFTPSDIASGSEFYEALDAVEERSVVGNRDRLQPLEVAYRTHDEASIAHWERREMWQTFFGDTLGSW